MGAKLLAKVRWQGWCFWQRLGWASAAALATAGCGGSGPAVGKVHGKVTYRGQAVAQATVTFTPTAAGGLPGIGLTNERGEYQLGTYSASDGALLGDHKISIVARAPYQGPVPAGAGGAYLEELQQRGTPLIPQHYFSAETSGLTAKVKRGRNNFDFQVSEAVPRTGE